MIGKINAFPEILSQFQIDKNATTSPSNKFSDIMASEMLEVNDKLIKSENVISDFAVGKEKSLPNVMLAIQESKMSFELMVQVRNRLMEGYNEIIKMQV